MPLSLLAGNHLHACHNQQEYRSEGTSHLQQHAQHNGEFVNLMVEPADTSSHDMFGTPGFHPGVAGNQQGTALDDPLVNGLQAEGKGLQNSCSVIIYPKEFLPNHIWV